jgi:hypothetical protein
MFYICVRQREIQTLHCSKWFTFFNAYTAQVFIWTHDTFIARVSRNDENFLGIFDKIYVELNALIINPHEYPVFWSDLIDEVEPSFYFILLFSSH